MDDSIEQIQFKVFLRKPFSSDKVEIRRFNFPPEDASNFRMLKDKILTVFPDLRRGVPYEITWTGMCLCFCFDSFKVL